MGSNVKTMKTKYILVFVWFITVTVLVSGCGKTDTKLASENADLKARVQKLEQQLKESGAQVASQGAPESQQASIQDLKSQLDEAQKKAEAAANELTTVSNQLATQQQKIDELTRELSDAQQARDKAEKALQLYRDKATSALQQFQALRSTLGDQTLNLDGYQQNYVATQTAVTKLVDALPESKVRRAILGVLAMFTRINDTCQTAARQMEARTKEAQANYDKFVDFGGLGPNDYVIQMGKDKILAPAEKDNAATASQRDQQVLSLEQDLDLGLKNLQALVNGQST
jgi:outer membrane murein-binding lipoprotein Lpp